MGCSTSTSRDCIDEITVGKSTGKDSSPQVGPQPPGVVCGYLSKEGAIYTTMRTRFFVLYQGKVTWYVKQAAPYSITGENEKGSLVLKDYKVMHKITKSKYVKQIVLSAPSTDQRSLLIEFLDPSNENVTNKWVEALQANIKYLDDLEEYNNSNKNIK